MNLQGAKMGLRKVKEAKKVLQKVRKVAAKKVLRKEVVKHENEFYSFSLYLGISSMFIWMPSHFVNDSDLPEQTKDLNVSLVN